MSKIPITLRTECFKKTTDVPGVSKALIKLDVITGIQLPGSAARSFSHYGFTGEGPKASEVVTLDEDMALRVLDFCDDRFVNGRGDFNCKTFVRAAMGWDLTGYLNFICDGVNPNETEAGQPYAVLNKEEKLPHMMLGTNRPGYNLGVIGPEYPLAITSNADMLRTFGGIAVMHIVGIGNPPITA